MNKLILITGAAKGIGFAIAKRFLQAGAKVILNDLSEERVSQGLDRLNPERGERLLGFAADVSKRQEVERLIHHVLDQWGGIDVLINNAGIYPNHPFLEMREEDWDRVMDVNAKGIFLVSQAAARAMVAGGIQGQIINISSGSYHVAREGSAHYCASKAAGVMLTKVMAMELAPYGIRVNAVAPGLIEVDTIDAAPGYLHATLKQTPMGRLGRPEDVADVVYQLVNMSTDYVTGAVVSVDGGLSLGRYGIPRS